VVLSFAVDSMDRHRALKLHTVEIKQRGMPVARKLLFDSEEQTTFSNEKPFVLIRKTDAYHLMNHTLSRESTLSHIIKQQLRLGSKQRGDLNSQSILYFHIIYGFLALNREFESFVVDIVRQMKQLYFLLYMPIIEKLNVKCCGSKELHQYRYETDSDSGSKPLLMLIQEEAPSMICHHCDELCHYDDTCCRIVYCRGCQNVYCHECSRTKKMMICDLCKYTYCQSHMIQRNICQFCMHPKPDEIRLLFGCTTGGVALYCGHIEHLTKKNTYDRLFCCRYCNVLTCGDHHCTDANLCIMCMTDIVNGLIRVKNHFWSEKIKQWIADKQLEPVSHSFRVINQHHLNYRMDKLKAYKIAPSFNANSFLISPTQSNDYERTREEEESESKKKKKKRKKNRSSRAVEPEEPRALLLKNLV
jgi:hypothetical protein